MKVILYKFYLPHIMSLLTECTQCLSVAVVRPESYCRSGVRPQTAGLTSGPQTSGLRRRRVPVIVCGNINEYPSVARGQPGRHRGLFDQIKP